MLLATWPGCQHTKGSIQDRGACHLASPGFAVAMYCQAGRLLGGWASGTPCMVLGPCVGRPALGARTARTPQPSRTNPQVVEELKATAPDPGTEEAARRQPRSTASVGDTGLPEQHLKGH